MYLLAAISLGLGSWATALGAKILIPIIVGIIIVPTMQALKRVWSWLDRASPKVKQATVGFLSIIGVTVAPIITALVGLDVPADITQWDQRIVSALLAALLGIAFKQSKQLVKANEILDNLGEEASRDAAFPFDIPPAPAPPATRVVRLANGEEWPLPPEQ